MRSHDAETGSKPGFDPLGIRLLGEAARCELVDLLFSLVWVLCKCLMSLLGHGLKSLGTTVLHDQIDV